MSISYWERFSRMLRTVYYIVTAVMPSIYLFYISLKSGIHQYALPLHAATNPTTRRSFNATLASIRTTANLPTASISTTSQNAPLIFADGHSLCRRLPARLSNQLMRHCSDYALAITQRSLTAAGRCRDVIVWSDLFGQRSDYTGDTGQCARACAVILLIVVACGWSTTENRRPPLQPLWQSVLSLLLVAAASMRLYASKMWTNICGDSMRSVSMATIYRVSVATKAWSNDQPTDRGRDSSIRDVCDGQRERGWCTLLVDDRFPSI